MNWGNIKYGFKRPLITMLLFLLIIVLWILVSSFWGEVASSSLILVVGLILLVFSSKIGLWCAEMVRRQRVMVSQFFGLEQKKLGLFWLPYKPYFYVWSFRLIGTTMSSVSIFYLCRITLS